MPYASLKQLRYMHAKEPEAAGRIDAHLRATGERAINRKRNISTVRKVYSEYTIAGPDKVEQKRSGLLDLKRTPVRRKFVEYRDDNGTRQFTHMSPGELEGSKRVERGSFSIGKAGDRNDWKNISQLEMENRQHRKRQKQGASAAGAGLALEAAALPYYMKNLRGLTVVDRDPETGKQRTSRTHYVGSPKERYAGNRFQQMFGVPNSSNYAFHPKVGRNQFHLTKPAAAVAAAVPSLLLGGGAFAAHHSIQEQRKAKMIAQRRKSRYQQVGKADFFGRQGLKNARERLITADRVADAQPTAENIGHAKFAAKMRNKALLKRTTRLAPVTAVPLLAAGVGGAHLERKRHYQPEGYGSGAYAVGGQQ